MTNKQVKMDKDLQGCSDLKIKTTHDTSISTSIKKDHVDEPVQKDSNCQLWGGRFNESMDPIMSQFNASISFDKAMWKQDIQGSVAYSYALEKVGILSKEESTLIREGLDQVYEEWMNKSFIIKENDEDIHTANERRLKEIVGTLGGKIHTGRSRNDQVAVDMKLWLREHLIILAGHLKCLLQVFIKRATEETSILMPGYTHLQRAQPIRWSHWLLSHAWSVATDMDRLKQVYLRTNTCPLGSGALAGTPFDIDRKTLAKDLGFPSITPNSLHAVADRDFVLEYLFWASVTSGHLSRLAEDLIIYSTSEFGFVRLSDAYATGSSIMPQKKNPDSLELIRGKTGRIMGHLVGFLTVFKGLPSTFNKDLQEDKEAMFDTAATMAGLLQVTAGTLATLKVDGSKCRASLTEDMLATDVAYYLVRKGMSFREAHELSGKVVKVAEEREIKFSELFLKDLQTISPLFAEDITSVWDFDHSVEQYKATGGTALASVNWQISELNILLNSYELK